MSCSFCDGFSAPGEYVAEWLQRKAQAGLDVAKEYVRVAKDRVDVLSSGKKFLDQGGAAVQEPILAKKVATSAIDLDIALMQQLAHLARVNAEEMHFSLDPWKRQACARAAESYGHAEKILNAGPPLAPTWGSDIERDAGMIMQFRLAKAHLGRYVGLAGVSVFTVGQQPTSAAGAGSMSDPTIEELICELFRLHDLNANGVLEEDELVKLNEKVAILHYGRDTDMAVVRAKYKALFRDKLSANGEPVPLEVFSKYMINLLTQLDTDPRAQVMILEQFIAEAESAREAFRFQSLASFSDAPFLSKLGIERPLPTSSVAPTSGVPNSIGTLAPPALAPAPAPFIAACPAATATRRLGVDGGAADGGTNGRGIQYTKGERIQVWSNSKQAWLDGNVQEAFETDTWSQGYAVPAGTIRVVSPAGTKWIMPQQASEVRKVGKGG